MKKHLRKINKQALGFSLTEILISLVLSMLIINMVLAAWLSLKNTARLQEDLSTLQDNTLLVSHILTHDLQLAGYVGCGHLTNNFSNYPVINHTDNPSYDLNLISSLQGYTGDKDWEPKLPSYLKKAVLPGSDVFTVTYLSLDPIFSLQADSKPNQLIVNHKPKLTAGDFLLIADCKQAEIFQVNTVQQNSKPAQQIISPTQSLAYTYTSLAQIGLLSKNTYFIGLTGRYDALKNPITALYVADVSGKKHEIIANVANMKVYYALHQGINPAYFTAQQINQNNNWPQVKQVKLALLLKSSQKFSMQPTTYTYLGETRVDPYGYLYKEVELVVYLHER